jgi:hypothetical protein
MSLPDERSATSRAEIVEVIPTADAGRESDPPPGSIPTCRPTVRTWGMILGAALLSGLASFTLGEFAPVLVPPESLPPEIAAAGAQRASAETELRMKTSRDRVATLTYGGLGMALALALGAAGGLSRRSARRAITAGVIGLILGGAAGAGATRALLPSYHATRAATPDSDVTNDLPLALRTHGGIWLAVGAAAGLALGLGLGGGARTAKALVGGILGAGLATAIYEFAGAIAFPMAQTFRPVAESSGPRLLAHLGMALCVAGVAYWAAHYLHLRRATS